MPEAKHIILYLAKKLGFFPSLLTYTARCLWTSF